MNSVTPSGGSHKRCPVPYLRDLFPGNSSHLFAPLAHFVPPLIQFFIGGFN
jgi:hypothetical protein